MLGAAVRLRSAQHRRRTRPDTGRRPAPGRRRPPVRAAFALLVASAPGIEVVGEAGTGRKAMELVHARRADPVVMNVRMPDQDGGRAARRLPAIAKCCVQHPIRRPRADLAERLADVIRACRQPGNREQAGRQAAISTAEQGRCAGRLGRSSAGAPGGRASGACRAPVLCVRHIRAFGPVRSGLGGVVPAEWRSR
ncbi:hypothetical protein GCM10017687_55960 [Streptomyces echinatus]